MNNQEYVHLHILISDKTGKAFGGYLNKAIISTTAKIIIDVIEEDIDKEFSDSIGLNIFKL